MRRKGAARIAAAMALALAAAPGFAAAKKDAAGADPNREICRSRAVVGSRVQRIRECHSAQQWEEMKLQERLGMLRRQTNGDAGCNYNPGVTGPCGIHNGGRDTPF